MDRNSKYTSWHNTLTNTKGRILEEFLMIKRLHKLNEESDCTTFRSRWGTSNIDITVTSNQLLSKVLVWEIREQECCSDHSIIRYATGRTTADRTEFEVQDVRCIVKKLNKEKFRWNLNQLAEKELCNINKEGGTEELVKHCVHAWWTKWTLKSQSRNFKRLWN